MWGIIVALISGALMSVQGVFNTGVTKQTSVWLANSWVQFSAFLICLIGFLWREKSRVPVGSLFQIDHKYMLLGGVIGAFITLTVIVSMNQLGPAKAVMLIVISQLLVAYGIELIGAFGVEKTTFSIQKLIGIGLAIAGFVTFKWE